MTILVTGGAGFIGSNFVVSWFRHSDEPVVNLDALTYAGNLQNLDSLRDDPRHIFVRGSIADADLVGSLLAEHQARAVVNFAAESHVDRSISSPEPFFDTNVIGTLRLIEASRHHFGTLLPVEQGRFRFVHVSTDEVFGSLGPNDPAFTEETSYKPNSPYSASKAASDHIVRSYFETFGLPTIITNCSNNYGPFHFPEKLVPLIITNALDGHDLPVYGDGQQVRDWLYVEDHCSAIRLALEKAKPGSTYNIGGNNERTNLHVVTQICGILDAVRPRSDGRKYSEQIKFVTDRPGHDRRYAIDSTKIRDDLGWEPEVSFEQGIVKTVDWYLDNQEWVAAVRSGAYLDWIKVQYQ
ncbi:dTDP-glucose 4,6-dehydratase (plasmid) [Devosia neptuniae]|uniref:dTDP-glucose 4,6-dehydratase n=1 Tax=Devosia neptuniae TaxID=191302 RepID=A0ABY6C957_9HYPH|nr:dTDP-glucose 4,6-dehydratase [Devosia neptuniae]UXN67836.1 dTDP-glucose 4,6-dehydratase [Devosia neptuniae]